MKTESHRWRVQGKGSGMYWGVESLGPFKSSLRHPGDTTARASLLIGAGLPVVAAALSAPRRLQLTGQAQGEGPAPGTGSAGPGHGFSGTRLGKEEGRREGLQPRRPWL